MEEIDVWRTATLLVRQHGEDAVFEAALRADGLFAKANFQGAAVWQRIGRAIEELERQRPRKGEDGPQPYFAATSGATLE